MGNRTALAALVALLLPACASFQGDRLGPVPDVSPPQSKPTVSVAVFGEARLSGEKRDLPRTALERYKEATREAYEESDFFSDVRMGLEESDLRAEVKITNSGNPNYGLAFLSGLTLMIIPAKATDIFEVETSFKDRSGATLGEFSRTEEMDTWIELLLIVAAPFAWPGSVLHDTLVDTNDAVLHDAADAGLFEQLEVAGSADRASNVRR